MIPKPAIRENPLHELVPELRASVRTAEVSGVEIRRHAGPEIGWSDEAA